nr:translation initiation factor IF-2-like [Desmodus rotundus]
MPLWLGDCECQCPNSSRVRKGEVFPFHSPTLSTHPANSPTSPNRLSGAARCGLRKESDTAGAHRQRVGSPSPMSGAPGWTSPPLSERSARARSTVSKGPQRAPRIHSLRATKEEVRMSCQTDRQATTQELRSGPVSGWAWGRVPGSFLPSHPTSSSSRRRPASPRPARFGRAHAAQLARSQRSTSSLPSPCPARAGGQHAPAHIHTPAPWLRLTPAAPSPPRARSSDGPGRGLHTGREPKPPALGAAGSRTHSSPSPRVNSSRARSEMRPHPPAGAPRRPAPARPARRRRRPLPGREGGSGAVTEEEKRS